jgi:membrane protein
MQVGVLGSVGLGLLIFTVISLMQKIERALNDIWQVPQGRSFAERFSGYLSILLIGPVLVFSSVGLTASVGHSSVVETIARIEPFGALIHLAGRLVPYLLIIIAFTAIYRLMPNTRVRITSALVGGVVAGVLWETVGWIFATYVVKSSNYPAIYSAFASLLLFMIWLYVAWVILLVGAAVAFYHQHPEYIGARRAQLLLSLGSFERLALGVAAAVARRFYDGKPLCSLNELARRFRVPEKIVEGLLDVLQRGGFVKATADDPPRYLPARPPEAVGAGELLRAVRNDGRGDYRMTTALTAQPAVQRAAEAAEAAAMRALAGITLKDLALDGAALDEEAADVEQGEQAMPSDLLRAMAAAPGDRKSEAAEQSSEHGEAAGDVIRSPAAGRGGGGR